MDCLEKRPAEGLYSVWNWHVGDGGLDEKVQLMHRVYFFNF